MSTDTGGNDEDPSPATHITLELSEDGETWIVTDEETGVTTQGETREHALEMIDEAVTLHKGETGTPVTDGDLREWGIDPETVENEVGVPDVPWFNADEE
ncbi:type II toxin-antitoxin system HicB family antitoxin [Halorubrum aethiopicum]|uniref:type II toxin-antitoxin system HicB family antitoxin n=1 Tax=Halorubrum aethiopicum TaxID=1758255 RepID=UPI000834CC1F|nr:type II toxin-antitoxin system HicB family antitoxin [Halorubrum aethiopicum]